MGYSNRPSIEISISTVTGGIIIDDSFWDDGDSSLPEDVYYGRTLRFGVSPLASETLRELVAEIRPLAKRIAAGSDIQLDSGFNHRGVLNEDARAAVDEIENLCGARESDLWVGTMELTGDWSCAIEQEITADSTAADIKEWVAAYEEQMVDCFPDFREAEIVDGIEVATDFRYELRVKRADRVIEAAESAHDAAEAAVEQAAGELDRLRAADATRTELSAAESTVQAARAAEEQAQAELDQLFEARHALSADDENDPFRDFDRVA